METLTQPRDQRLMPIRSSSPGYRWHCHADPLCFIAWQAIPVSLQQTLQGTPLPCERTGAPGPWCSACAWHTVTTDGGL